MAVPLAASGKAGSRAAKRPIRVMIVDDSAIARSILTRIVAADPGFEVVAQAANADQAREILTSVLVDIVTLDLEMPNVGGLAALPGILSHGRGARVIVVSSLAENGAAAAVQALGFGAADTIPKPGGGRAQGGFSALLLAKMRTIGHARREEIGVAESGANVLLDDVRLRPMSNQPIRCLTIGASTGGLHAISKLFADLPFRIGIPILVTQHLPAVFIPFFARQLGALTGRDAEVAVDRSELVSDRILIAPGDGHLRVASAGKRMLVRIDRSGAVGGCLPAVDPMFASVAEHYGAGACAVVLTGMGRDGLAGSGRMADAGATIYVQDPASSAVWGMPRSVADAGLASAVLEPGAIARLIAARTGAVVAGAASWT